MGYFIWDGFSIWYIGEVLFVVWVEMSLWWWSGFKIRWREFIYFVIDKFLIVGLFVEVGYFLYIVFVRLIGIIKSKVVELLRGCLCYGGWFWWWILDMLWSRWCGIFFWFSCCWFRFVWGVLLLFVLLLKFSFFVFKLYLEKIKIGLVIKMLEENDFK